MIGSVSYQSLCSLYEAMSHVYVVVVCGGFSFYPWSSFLWQFYDENNEAMGKHTWRLDEVRYIQWSIRYDFQS